MPRKKPTIDLKVLTKRLNALRIENRELRVQNVMLEQQNKTLSDLVEDLTAALAEKRT